MGETFLLFAGIALAGALLCTFLIRPKHAPNDETIEANPGMMAGHIKENG
ncbi:hypothetical protein [Bacillus sp. SA1-12]|nr:hypothetical protein [Bacillus sp. SA1-12]